MVSIIIIYICTISTLSASVVIQILFDPQRKHWITTSYKDGVLKLYDSCFNLSLSPSIEEQLARIYKHVIINEQLPVTVIPVQQQKGAYDCGLFSIAFTYHVALGGDVSNAIFQQQEMRPHLKTCFEARELSPFPHTKKTIKNYKLKITVVHSCFLHMPTT